MAEPDIVETACARAWSVYLLINKGVAENDARRASLERFIRKRWEAGDNEAEFLVVEGLKYLKKLDGSSDDYRRPVPAGDLDREKVEQSGFPGSCRLHHGKPRRTP